MIFIDYQKFC